MIEVYPGPRPHRCSVPLQGNVVGDVAHCTVCDKWWEAKDGEYGMYWRRIFGWAGRRKARGREAR